MSVICPPPPHYMMHCASKPRESKCLGDRGEPFKLAGLEWAGLGLFLFQGGRAGEGGEVRSSRGCAASDTNSKLHKTVAFDLLRRPCRQETESVYNRSLCLVACSVHFPGNL